MTAGLVREMQAVLVESWRLEKPLVERHVGDLAWWSRELDRQLRVWHKDGDPVAWGWVSPPAELDFHVRGDARGRGLEREVLAWYEEVANGETFAAWALDADTAKCEALVDAGYSPLAGAGFHHLVRLLAEASPAPLLPPGFSLRDALGPEDVERRVAVQRSAFTSTMTVEKYERLRATWPYRPDLDVVVEAPDGSFAAFCLAWLDEENRVGELEPVGVRADLQRTGLGRAVSLAALERLRRAGADTCVVYAVERPDYPAPFALYTGLGFESRARHVRYERRR